MYQHTPSFLVDMKKRRTIRVLAILVFLVTILTGGWSFFTEYQIQQVRSEGGIALEVAGDEGIAHVSQSGYRVKKGDIGWYKRGDIANVKETTRTGYTFLGWYQDTTKVSDSNPYSHTMTAATKLVAKTKINSYRITAELDGGTINGSTSWSTTYTIKDNVTLPTPVKTGYNFLGWVEKGTNGTPNKNVVIPVGSTGDKTYVAKWEIKTFEVDVNGILDGGAVQESTKGMGTFDVYVNGVLATRNNYYDYCDRAVPYGTEIEIKNIKALEGRTYVKSSQSLKFTVTGNVYMTLQFKTNEYTYRFNANGGTGSMSDIKAKHGISVKIPASTFKKDYHTQTDWNTVAGGTDTKYALGGTISGYSGKDGDVVTLYAQWRKNKVYLSFHTNKSKMGSLAGSDFGIDSDGYITRGNKRHTYSGDFDSYISDSTNSLPDVKLEGHVYLERTGYSTEKATAWNTKSDGTGKSFSDDGGILAKEFADAKDGDKSVVLYANWKPNNYKVRYNGNGATSGTMTDSAHVYDTAKVLTRNAYARTGYTFTGWNTKHDGKGTAYADGASVKNLTSNKDGVVTLYAQWKVNSYTLTYNANGGTVSPSSKKLDYNEAYGTLPTPVRKGYRFEGWYTATTGGTKVSSTTKMGTKDTTIYARWTENTLTINYHAEGAQTFEDLDLETGNELGDISVSGKDVFKTYTMTYTDKLPKFGLGDVHRLIRSGYRLNGDDLDNWYMKDDSGVLSIAVNDSTVYTALQLATLAGKQTAFETGNITIDIYPKWTINNYSYEIHHWASGFKNQEGNNEAKNQFKLKTDIYTAKYNSTYILDSSKKTTVPNGFYLHQRFGSSYLSSDYSWQIYPFGTKVTQKAGTMTFEYDYSPNTYKITYNLNGGTNNSENPTSYTVLYGVTLKNPTRVGYTFDGWYNGSTKVTGINEGKNATFSSASELYSELAKRTTGDITLTAKWTPITYKNKIDHWAWGFTNNEGNNTDKNALKLGSTYFDAEYNSKYTMDSSLKTTIPNGFKFMPTFSTEAIDGVWKGYPIGTQVTQKSDSMRYEYGYQPITYKITYNLNGGTNNSSNPSYYNVLYGVSLTNPTRTGYTFDGWYIGGTKVTGINEGKKANFATSAELYSELEKRTIGDVALEARWTPKTLTYNVQYVSSSGKTLGSSTVSGTFGTTKDIEAPAKTGYVTPDKQSVVFDSENAKTIKFVYTPTTYNITLKNATTNGTDKKIPYTIETPTFSLESPSKTGYTFTGWTGSNGSTPQKTVTISQGSTGDRVYTANWKAASVLLETGSYFKEDLLKILGYTSVRSIQFVNTGGESMNGYYTTDVSANKDGSIEMCARYDGGSMSWMNIFIYSTVPDMKIQLNPDSNNMWSYLYNNSLVTVDFGYGIVDDSLVGTMGYPSGSNLKFTGDDICGLVTHVNNQSLNIIENSEDSSILDVIDTLTPQLDGTTKDSEDTSDTVVEQSDETNNDSDGKVDESQPTSGSTERGIEK